MSKKFAILSHILPPSASGQAIVFHRLLKDLPKDDYILLSRQDYSDPGIDKSGSAHLPGKYYFLHSAAKRWKYGRFFPFYLAPFRILLQAWPTITSRAKDITRILEQEKPFCLLGCTADLYDIPAGYIACRRTGTPFIPYIFDDYVYQWTGWDRRFAWLMAKWIMPRSNRIIGPNSAIAKSYKKRYGTCFDILHNPCPMPELPLPKIAEKFFDPQEISIVYTGAVYRANSDAFQNLVEALKQLALPQVKLHIFSGQSAQEVANLGIKGPFVEVHSHVNQSKILYVLDQATILFLPLAFRSPVQEVVSTSAPSKMGEYMAMQKPILIHAPKDCFLSQYFKENKVGLVVDQDDPTVLAQALKDLIDHPLKQQEFAKRARQQAQRDFDIKVVRQNFKLLMENIYQSTPKKGI